MLSLIYFLTSTLHKPPLRHSIRRAVLLSFPITSALYLVFSSLVLPFLFLPSILIFSSLIFSSLFFLLSSLPPSFFSLLFPSPFRPSFVCSSSRKAFQSVERERELLRQTVHTADVMSALVSCSYNFIFSYLILSDLISSHPISSCPISFHPISSCPISFHHILSYPISFHHILSYSIPPNLIFLLLGKGSSYCSRSS